MDSFGLHFGTIYALRIVNNTLKTMPYSNISAMLPPENLNALLTKLEEIDNLLPFLVSLSNEERQRLFKAGASRVGAVTLAQQIATSFPEIFPATFSKSELDKDVVLMAPLQTISLELAARASGVDDTLLALRSECMHHVLTVYKYAKAAQDTVPGVKPLVEQMAVYFERGPQSADEPSAAPVPTPA